MPDSGGHAALWDWRRQTTSIYAAVRAGGAGEAAWRTWRDARDRLFRSHPQTPVEQPAAFEGLPYFPYNPALRFVVQLRPIAGEAFTAPAGADGAIRLQPFALTAGLEAALGRELTLFWVEGYGGGAFLPFADSTAGHETYGGGRYLLDTIKGADLGTDSGGETVLDFNYAYNPSCSYSARYVCPLSPPGNRFGIAIQAGERHRS